jgi:uncharacterized protein
MSEPDTRRSRTPGAGGVAPRDDRLWGAFAHLGGIFWFLPSLVIFLTLAKKGPTTRIESKEALNWQITVSVCLVVLSVVALIIGGIGAATAAATGADTVWLLALLPELVVAAVWLVDVVFSLLGFLRVNGGGSYRYPFALRFIK